jgi:hypothetical protein
MEPAEAARWRRQLEETAHPCGCKSGAALTLVALVAWPLWILIADPPRSASDLAIAVLAYPLVVVFAALTGKVAGIFVGRRRHRLLLRQLSRRAPAPLTEAGAH